MNDKQETCSISDCCNPRYCKKYCRSHYGRFHRHGDPLAGGTSNGEPMRFIHEVALNYTSDECLTWPFATNGWGYGAVQVGDKMVGVHRYVCELVRGAPPTSEHQAAHSCGKGRLGCISPIHLSWKTRIENKDDELLHGTRSRGERNARAKLTDAEARAILALKGAETQSKLATRFGVSYQAIASIHTGRTWAWLSEEAKEIAS
ncbi:hypothetical protein [Rhizobium hidalgonense]|uniref:hypothetical protein n=1 Tax=Rhizobium hidalgonense TaxID=1538159 RepID=UPI002872546E|nr:hypothetical protein [Rhizobium hidalgonense]MDR9813083.1 hypothetical protein [Rhizobium hidalgonense]